jgi:uncharacterized protein
VGPRCAAHAGILRVLGCGSDTAPDRGGWVRAIVAERAFGPRLEGMSVHTPESAALRERIDRNRAEIKAVLARYGASNPRIFGSVARGTATADSDLDLLVDLDPEMGNALLAVAGIGEELSDLVGVRVDVVAEVLLRGPVSTAARAELVPL